METHVSPCIESRCYGNNGDVKGVEGGAGGQQSWWLNHSNQTCESEVGVNDNVNIFLKKISMVQKK